MITANRQGTHPLGLQPEVVLFDILQRLFEAVAAAKRDITNISGTQSSLGHPTKGRVVRSNALNRAHRAWAETGARAIGDPEVHRHADDRDIQVGRAGHMRQTQESRYAGIGQRAPAVR